MEINKGDMKIGKQNRGIYLQKNIFFFIYNTLLEVHF